MKRVSATNEKHAPTALLIHRKDDGVSAQTQRNHRASRTWVTAYTPHRLVLATADQTDRILLDTSAMRKVIHGDAMRSTSRG
jgi:hypothetical protein